MLKIVKRGGIVVAAGVLVGLGVVGWMRFHPQDSPVANSRGGMVELDTAETPTPTPEPGSLTVASPGDVSESGGGAQTLIGGSSGGGSGSTAGASTSSSDSSAKKWPAPEEFSQYDQYLNAESTMYGDMRVGTGDEAKAGNVLKVKYRGWLTDGRLFDESYSRGELYEFTLGTSSVIQGWSMGFAGMKVGGMRRLIIPPEFGYGATGKDPIPGNSVLTFDVELMEVK